MNRKTVVQYLALALALVLLCVLLPRIDLAVVATAETVSRQPGADPAANGPIPIYHDSDEDLPPATEWKCGPNLTAKWDEDALRLTITGTGPMYDYSEYYSAPWPWYVDRLSLPNGMTSIGDYAFNDRIFLYDVSIPNSLTRIGEKAFSGCDLKTLELPAKVAQVDCFAFLGNDKLKQVVIRNPDCLVAIEEVDSSEDLYFPDGTLGDNNKVIIYGKHRADRENAAVIKKSGYAYAYAENYAKRCGYTFYATNAFSDVAEGKFYEIPVAWANGKGITNGTDDTHFSPEKACTRGQVVTFLWRANGSPAPKTTSHSFKDVNSKAYYYKAMLWAVENGITTGTDKTHFSPDKSCSRGQVVTFLWRAKGWEEPTLTTTSFTDVNSNAYYYKAMLWALQKNITTGTDKTHFSPGKECTRGQVVTFLFRADPVPAVFNALGDQFLFYTQEVFTVTGRGTVLTGRVENGRVDTGDHVRVMTYDDSKQPVTYEVTVEGIEMFHKLLDYAEKGDNVGILIGTAVDRTQVKTGAALVHSDSRLQFSQDKKLVGYMDLNGSAPGSGVDMDYTYQFVDSATDYTVQFLDMNGSNPLPMGSGRGGVVAKEIYAPVVWYIGQKLTIRRGGHTFGTYTITGFQD